MFTLKQGDLDTFNTIKLTHEEELAAANVDVVPIPNGTYSGDGIPPDFIPDGTYSLDYSFFPPEAQNFLNDFISQNFFINL